MPAIVLTPEARSPSTRAWLDIARLRPPRDPDYVHVVLPLRRSYEPWGRPRVRHGQGLTAEGREAERPMLPAP